MLSTLSDIHRAQQALIELEALCTVSYQYNKPVDPQVVGFRLATIRSSLENVAGAVGPKILELEL